MALLGGAPGQQTGRTGCEVGQGRTGCEAGQGRTGWEVVQGRPGSKAGQGWTGFKTGQGRTGWEVDQEEGARWGKVGKLAGVCESWRTLQCLILQVILIRT